MFVLRIACVLIVGLGGYHVAEGYADYEDLDNDQHGDVEDDFYDSYEDPITTSTVAVTNHYDDEGITRVRRYEDNRISVKTLSPEEIKEVKGMLKQLLRGHDNEKLTILKTINFDYKSLTTINFDNNSLTTIHFNDDFLTTIPPANYLTTEAIETETIPSNNNTIIEAEETSAEHFYRQKVIDISHTHNDYEENNEIVTDVEYKGATTYKAPLRQNETLLYNFDRNKRMIGFKNNSGNDTLTTTTPMIDIERIIAILDNLTYEYDTNLTKEFKDTLTRLHMPTCPTPTTTPPPTTTTEPTTETTVEWDNTTGTIIAKCFVCGLTMERIPTDAACGDAFATDFLPLTPIDPTAKSQISKYRKYCRYLNIYHYRLNDSDPRSVWGRWSGGCAVRWIDLSTVYTQRTCRCKSHAITGKHFLSKRMAKLEMALKSEENGCIISPMATLVPFSRGISLYARFHACVCTGHFCNISKQKKPWMWYILIMSLLSAISSIT